MDAQYASSYCSDKWRIAKVNSKTDHINYCLESIICRDCAFQITKGKEDANSG